jgi:uncharacterized protein
MNPFFIQQYGGAKYFCDREDELQRLIEAATNNRSLMLHSMRRMGKTGLIFHLHNHLRTKHNTTCIYIDILDTMSDQEFVNQFVSASISSLYSSQSKILNKLTAFFGKYKPKFSIDTLTGSPVVELDVKTQQEIELSLETTFALLAESKLPIHIAIDEFQQIGNYPSTRIDATLRKYLTQSKNIHMLFSGSQRHLLLDLFNDPKRPMYRSVEQMEIHEIPYPMYSEFISKMFALGKKKIDDRVVHRILQWTKSHTFYAQYVCNRLYSKEKNTLTEHDLALVQHQILKELEMNFLSYRNILSKNQYRVLEAIAKEGTVQSVRSKAFTTTHNLASSTAQQSLDYLVEKELVYEKLSKEGSSFFVYDLFLSRWLES